MTFVSFFFCLFVFCSFFFFCLFVCLFVFFFFCFCFFLLLLLVCFYKNLFSIRTMKLFLEQFTAGSLTDKCMESSKHDWTLSGTAISLQFFS